jgi:hypothetical protein
VSGLYFRGKLAYAQAFQKPPKGVPGVLVIAPGSGLLSPAETLSVRALRRLGSVPVSPDSSAYTRSLGRDARALRRTLPADAEVVLLGSLATGKYLDPLGSWMGPHLRVPEAFFGLGQLGRGSLLLESVERGEELSYVAPGGREVKASHPL